MDAVDFIKTKNRMTKHCNIKCEDCLLSWENNRKDDMGCHDFIDDYPEEAVSIVKEWAEEHPLKTRADVFYERFPDAPKNDYGLPDVCPEDVGLSEEGVCDFECECCWKHPAPDKYQY